MEGSRFEWHPLYRSSYDFNEVGYIKYKDAFELRLCI